MEIHDRKLSEKLQLEAELTLEKAITTVRQSQSVKKQQSTLHQDKPGTEASVDAIGKYAAQRSQKAANKSIQTLQKKALLKSPSTFCTRCGRLPPHDRTEYPANDAICHLSSKHGHFKTLCKTARCVANVYQQNPSDDDSSDDLTYDISSKFIGVVIDQSSPAWTVSLIMNNHKTEFTIDTRASVTVISEQLCKQIRCPFQASSYTLCSPDHQTLTLVGKGIVTL